MRFAIRDHQGKSRPYLDALLAAGHTLSRSPDVVLMDYDLPHPRYDLWATLAPKVIIYPHGFSATMQSDLIEEPIRTDATLVPGPGQKQIMEAYGYPNPLHVSGWPGPRIELTPRECKRVLFAPRHPFGSGWLPDADLEANASAFETLLSEPYELAVRHCGTLEQNGLWHEDGVRYIQGSIDDGQVDVADVVVADGTYVAKCMALGVPVVMNQQELAWALQPEDRGEVTYPEGWEAWREFTRYPFELAPGVCEQAAAEPNPPELREWKERFIGPPFDPQAFVRLVEETVKGD